MPLRRIYIALLVAAGTAASVPACAQEFSLANFFQAFSSTPSATTTGWTATVIRQETVVATAKDPFWTAVIHARRGSDIETGSLTAHLTPASIPRITGAPHAMTGTASYYWQDQMTASGEVFNRHEMTAAHKTLPLGTKVRVTNLDNGRSTVVRINDRGPYVGDRVIDLSEAAADVLGMRTRGLAPVRVDLVGQ